VEYKKRTKNDPNRLIYQAVDSLLVITEAIRQAGTTDSAKILDVMRKSKFEGARGLMTFDTFPGVSYQQWAAIPYVNYQLTDVNQAVGKTTLLQGPGMPLNTSKITMPK